MNAQLITERLKNVGLVYIANQLDGILEDVSKHNVTYSEFLNTLLQHEIEHKEGAALETRIKKSKLPFHKTIEDFDFSFQPSVSERRV